MPATMGLTGAMVIGHAWMDCVWILESKKPKRIRADISGKCNRHTYYTQRDITVTLLL